MACNLRSRALQQELLDKDRDESVIENSADANVDDDSDNSDREYSVSECTFQSDSEMELELEEASLNQCLLESRAQLDQTVVNARILLKCKLRADNSTGKCRAIMCFNKLYMYLITPYITQRYETSTLRRDIKIGIAMILKIDIQKDEYQRMRLTSRQRCAFCTSREDKKPTKRAPIVNCQFAIITDYISVVLALSFNLILLYKILFSFHVNILLIIPHL